MTVVLMIRHGANDMLDSNTLAGRLPEVHLNARGRQEAAALAEHLASQKLAAVYSSPLERTRETAAPIAVKQGLPVKILPAVTEVEFGQWTGRRFNDLAEDSQWRAFNQWRSGTRIPDGENGLEVQLRMITALERLHGEHGRATIAVVSHGDPIRSVIAYCLSMPIGAVLRLQIDPASVSVVDFTCWHAPRVRCVNSNGQGLPL